MSELKRIIMNRDGLSSEEADRMISNAQDRVMKGEDPEEILYSDFSLEPDFFFDLLPY